MATARGTSVPPASAEHALEWLPEAAKDGVATGGDGAEEARPFVSCPSCEATNPADSTFCAECGAPFVVLEA